MSIVAILVPMAVGLGLCFAAAFVWMSLNGQFDELDTPAHRILLEESATENKTAPHSNERT